MENKNPKGAGRKKGDRKLLTYWADPKTHETMSLINKERKSKNVSDSDLESICKMVRQIVDRNLSEVSNQIIGK